MKKRNDIDDTDDFEEMTDCDDQFSFIAGYTSNGVPYGTTWEEEGISMDLPFEEKTRLLDEKYQFGKAHSSSLPNNLPEAVSLEDPNANIYLEDISESFEMCMDEWNQFLNTKTGEIVSLPSSFSCYYDWTDEDTALAEEIDCSGDYLRLPDQYDLNEYAIMWSFADEYADQRVKSRLLEILNRRKPFRNFKDAIGNMGIAEQYYAYREKAFIEKAKEWCEDNNVKYKRKRLPNNGGRK